MTHETGVNNLAAASTRELLEELRARGNAAVPSGHDAAFHAILAQGAFDLLDELPDTLLDYRAVREPLRPSGAPRLGETYRDWRDFVDRVARPWVENDGDDARADNWYRTLMVEADVWYLAVALVMADNRIRALEAADYREVGS